MLDYGFAVSVFCKGTLKGSPNREPQEYSSNMREIYLPGSLYFIIFLLYSWGSLFGVPIKVPLYRIPETIFRGMAGKLYCHRWPGRVHRI